MELTELRANGIGDLRGRRLAAEIRRSNLPRGDDALDGAEDAVVQVAVAEVIEHHARRPRSRRSGWRSPCRRCRAPNHESARTSTGNVRSGLMLAPGAMPRLPEIADPMSVRMSPKRFDADDDVDRVADG